MVLGIFGASGFGREILETANLLNEKENRWKQIIFVDDNPDLSIVADIQVYSLLKAKECFEGKLELILAIGEPSTRRKIIDRANELEVPFTTLIHPDIVIPKSTKIGNGCYIGPHSFISCNVTIGEHSYIQPNVNISHDCVLEDNVNICGMTTVAGGCYIEHDVFLGMGVSVIQCCRIGHHTIVGMGAVVHKELPEEVTAIGNPAKIIRKNTNQRVFK